MGRLYKEAVNIVLVDRLKSIGNASGSSSHAAGDIYKQGMNFINNDVHIV
jgi:hypothetical protein